jgi:hypothetical protein
MNLPRPLDSTGGSARLVRKTHQPWTVRTPQPRPTIRSSAYTRRYEVTWLDANGQVQDLVKVAPALPIFESAFSAFAHGALIHTTEGQVAVEDLQPGTLVETASGGTAQLRWVGAITMVPGAPVRDGMVDHTYRMTADTFGPGRPSMDVTFGPGARLLNRNAAVVGNFGSEAALTPVSAMTDGVSVVEMTPVSPVRVYHLAFDEHVIVLANGLEVESFHPGPDAHYSLSNEMREMFLALFPHIDSLAEFGRMLWPRLESEHELDELG